MTYFDLSNRFELAVMALAIKKAHEVFAHQSGGGYLGRTALQKIMYFLTRRGIPLPYRFEIYHYGPFCSDIYHDVDCLQADEVVVDKAQGTGKYWNYAPGPNTDVLIELYGDEMAEYEDVIDEVINIFADLSPNALELIATLDYIYQDEKARRRDGLPEKQAVVERFIQVKKDKFPLEMVNEMYDVLLNAKIFDK